MSEPIVPRDVPEGCLEIPGFIVESPDRKSWMTQGGQMTDKWSDRGMWATPEEAEAARSAIGEGTK